MQLNTFNKNFCLGYSASFLTYAVVTPLLKVADNIFNKSIMGIPVNNFNYNSWTALLIGS